MMKYVAMTNVLAVLTFAPWKISPEYADMKTEKRVKGESGGYGKYVGHNDFSKLSEKRKSYDEIVACRQCGKEFERPPGTDRKMCDECKKKNQSTRMKKIWEEKKNEHTTNT